MENRVNLTNLELIVYLIDDCLTIILQLSVTLMKLNKRFAERWPGLDILALAQFIHKKS